MAPDFTTPPTRSASPATLAWKVARTNRAVHILEEFFFAPPSDDKLFVRHLASQFAGFSSRLARSREWVGAGSSIAA
jgi:hypothetical protein